MFGKAHSAWSVDAAALSSGSARQVGMPLRAGHAPHRPQTRSVSRQRTATRTWAGTSAAGSPDRQLYRTGPSGSERQC
jgi:hypothetical protein